MKLFLLLGFLLITPVVFAQDLEGKLNVAIDQLELDSQFRHSIISLYIVDGSSGKVMFDHNSRIGLAPASCQKVITSISAFELLGKDYSYTTTLAYSGTIRDDRLNGDLYINGTGDPTLGSWRFSSTKENIVLNKFIEACKHIAPKGLSDHSKIKTNQFFWGPQTIPDGWIWQDIGNYYGAGASSLNWRENQFDLILKSGNSIGDPVSITQTNPAKVYGIKLLNRLKAGPAGSGDNAYIYLPPGSCQGYLLGSIPIAQNHFVISGAYPEPAYLLRQSLFQNLSVSKAKNTPLHPINKLEDENSYDSIDPNQNFENVKLPGRLKTFYTHSSPPFDSINFWFLKKSINLYGEAIVKTIAFKLTSVGTTDSGVSCIRRFWSDRGIDGGSLKIIDGSGLSPGNRVTTKALVTVLLYGQNKTWFPSFYYDLPEINGIKMKDGYINGVRSYAGYTKSKNGRQYTFAFVINNFDGNPGSVREKMWKVLDIIK